MYLVIGIVLAFIVSFWKDNRSLWNPVLFLIIPHFSSYFYLAYLFIKMDMRMFSWLFMYFPLFYFLLLFLKVASF